MQAGAVIDIGGNGILALNADGVDNDGDNGTNDEKGAAPKIGKSIADIVYGDGDAEIDAANVLVTPVLFSGVETVYDGDPVNIVLDLKFSEELSMVTPSRITITNDKDEAPFKLSSSEFDTITTDGIPRLARFKLTKVHRDKVSYWQADPDITELRVKLDAGAVQDAYGASSEATILSERIVWDEDNEGPIISNISTYNQSTMLLSLRFHETLDLTPEGDETIDDLVVEGKSITLSPDIGGFDSIELTNDELVPNQKDNWWLKYTLTTANNDAISNWKGLALQKSLFLLKLAK
jgi:hypothetical protein